MAGLSTTPAVEPAFSGDVVHSTESGAEISSSGAAATRVTPSVAPARAAPPPPLTLASPSAPSAKSQADGGGIVKAGYLYKQGSGVRKEWKKRWFFVRNGKLCYIRNKKNMSPAFVCDLVVTNVRETIGGARNSFELRSTGSRVYYLQALTSQQRFEWITVLRAETESMILSGRKPLVPGSSTGHGITSDTENPDLPLIKAVQEQNPICADCAAPNPDWTSLNLGVLICIACSGVHRSLGVHLSKVRSLTLDRLDSPCFSILEQLGNDRVNATYEAEVSAGWSRPEASANRTEREKWIRTKYEKKAFLPEETLPVTTLGDVMCKAAEHGDVVNVMRCLAYGVPVNWQHSERNNRTALHIACAAGQLAVVEFLILNGGSILEGDGTGKTCVDVADASGQSEVSAWLAKRLKDGCS